MEVEAIARVCHAVNRALCFSFGDFTQNTWEQAEQWQRDSAIKGVEYRLANPDASESSQHDAWCNEKLADGWKYGPIKDASKKEHPCLVPFGELPPEQRAKDVLFCTVVDELRNA